MALVNVNARSTQARIKSPRYSTELCRFILLIAVMLDYEIHEYPNGIRLLHKQVLHTKIAHCGFLLDIGSRDEDLHQMRIKHRGLLRKGDQHERKLSALREGECEDGR